MTVSALGVNTVLWSVGVPQHLRDPTPARQAAEECVQGRAMGSQEGQPEPWLPPGDSAECLVK